MQKVTGKLRQPQAKGSVLHHQVVIIGAGIIGLTIARELLMQGYEDIVLLEKEGELGAHASGRNSGVLHAGIYYSPDSLKAKFCIEGNRLMKTFCRQHNLTLCETGKVIVARNASELPALEQLYTRGRKNGAKVEMVNAEQLAEIEPHAQTHEKALYSPETAVVQPAEILAALEQELTDSRRCRVLYRTEFQGLNGDDSLHTNRGSIKYDLVINAAGVYADKVAKAFGVGMAYHFLPFKGTYHQLRQNRADLVKGNIYPVPDSRNPFLGVHFTRGADGIVTIGPTAIPAFGRENYHWLREYAGRQW